MDQVYEILIHKVTEYGGTVNELRATGSWPYSAPLLPWRMPPRGRSAPSLAIHREMVQFNDKMRREKPGLPAFGCARGFTPAQSLLEPWAVPSGG